MTYDETFVFGVADAVKTLRPDSIFTLRDRDFIEWWDPTGLPAPSWNEVEQQMAKDKAIWDSLEYARERVKNYPEAKEQVDQLWHFINSGGIVDQSSEWFQNIKKIKETYPKP